MESLSPECTNLKHRYDQCFNAWFEGYLKPIVTPHAEETTPGTDIEEEEEDVTPDLLESFEDDEEEEFEEEEEQDSSATLSATSGPADNSVNPTVLADSDDIPDQPLVAAVDAEFSDHIVSTPSEPKYTAVAQKPVVTIPLTTSSPKEQRSEWARAKKEEYDRNCGALWTDYRGCLQRAIDANHPLSALLTQARLENPIENAEAYEGGGYGAPGAQP
ncbi:hypothetical protein QFC22_005355 [Naganishia vaughanmartiniae]|uniref:Uncharacterized protein n=1 Tax=Naganishia vaughanmartiniae TaxID=1424756 RepID=A0ACC2WTR7_9TREE|nr:hypothetical protein QFC22_005355 [Naganishia vaughanmartiniae]